VLGLGFEEESTARERSSVSAFPLAATAVPSELQLGIFVDESDHLVVELPDDVLHMSMLPLGSFCLLLGFSLDLVQLFQDKSDNLILLLLSLHIAPPMMPLDLLLQLLLIDSLLQLMDLVLKV
jgi:hypothetical protein